MYNQEIYEGYTFYEDFFRNLYFPSDIKKNVKSDWFYLGKDYNFRKRYNNEENYIMLKYDLFVDRTKMEDLKEIFENQKGKLTPFWLEVYNNKINLHNDVTNGDNFINVKHRDNYLNLNDRKKHLILRDGSYTTRNEKVKIDNVQNIIDYERINLNNAVNFDIIKGEEIINELLLVRFDSDKLTFKRITPELFTVSISFKELIQETP